MRRNPAVLDYYAIARESSSPEATIISAMGSGIYERGYNDALTHPQPRDTDAEYLNGFAAGWLKRHGQHTGRLVETRIENGAAKRLYRCNECRSEFRA